MTPHQLERSSSVEQRSVRAPGSLRIYLFDFFEGTPRSSFDTYSRFLESITKTKRKFFDYLDLQIDKVEDFYGERYKEAVLRLAALKEQFQKLAEHRMAYHVSPIYWGGLIVFNIPLFQKAQATSKTLPNLPAISAHTLESAYNRISMRLRQGKVPETIRGFQELYSSDQWREVLHEVRATHTILSLFVKTIS